MIDDLVRSEQDARTRTARASAARQAAEAQASEQASRRRKAEAELAALRARYDNAASNDRESP